ncbi:hypothetical protein [Roseovarius aestuariivivens]|uniref:hypothetical protein n=1 Tax=Roseovarius aestuariivivens TaxID=1888910 RepID=UPI001082188E|nr:hypothetical protein [Roseovarius aestuariivivens]
MTANFPVNIGILVSFPDFLECLSKALQALILPECQEKLTIAGRERRVQTAGVKGLGVVRMLISPAGVTIGQVLEKE